MNIKPLFEKQYENNKNLIIDTSLNEYKISARKNLELNIKLSALANETRCYGYCIDNSPCEINENIVFQKYLDVLSSIISIGIDKKYSNSCEIEVVESEDCLSDLFLTTYIDLNDLTISPSEDHFQALLEDFVSLGLALGYTEQKIIDTFMIN